MTDAHTPEHDAGPTPPVDTTTARPRGPLPHWVRPVAATVAVLVGVGGGAGAGAAIGADAGADRSATALVQVVQSVDPLLAGTSPLRSLPGETQTFVANEMAWLTSPAFRSEVVRSLPAGADPGLAVTRQGQSEVVAFTVTDGTVEAAASVVRVAVDRYTARRVEQLGAQIQGALDDVQRTLDEIAHSPVASSEAEQQSRVALLREQQAQLLRLRFDGASPVRVLGPPVADPPPPAEPALVGAVLGAVLGGLVGVTAIRLVPRRRPS